MTLVDILQQNLAAVIGLVGVVVGATLAGLASLLTQTLQSRWSLKLQRIEWKRARREAQLNTLISWVNQWLRSAAQVRRAEDTIHSVVPENKEMRRIAFMQMDKVNEEQTRRLSDLTATSAPVVYMIGDDRLTELYENFRSTIAQYKDALDADDVDAAIEENRQVVLKARDLASEIQRRADELIDEAFEI